MNDSPTEIKKFEFSGGWLCLDFTNTANGDIHQEWTENLVTYRDLVAWSQQAGILHDPQALLHAVSLHPTEADQVVESAHTLRQTIYDVFSAVAQERAPNSEHLAALNVALSEAGQRLQIAPVGDDFTHYWAAEASELEQILWPIIWSAGELLLSENHQLVRECGGSNCSWLFLDTSRNHSRRWCDMKGCGNRAKARRHYARSKTADTL